jgi:hypothetical protein
VHEATTAFLAASNTGNRAAWIGSMTKAAQAQMETPEGKKVSINQKTPSASIWTTPRVLLPAYPLPRVPLSWKSSSSCDLDSDQNLHNTTRADHDMNITAQDNLTDLQPAAGLPPISSTNRSCDQPVDNNSAP